MSIEQQGRRTTNPISPEQEKQESANQGRQFNPVTDPKRTGPNRPST